MKKAVFIPEWETTGFGGKPNPSDSEQSNSQEKLDTSTEEKKNESDGK